MEYMRKNVLHLYHIQPGDGVAGMVEHLLEDDRFLCKDDVAEVSIGRHTS